MHHQGGREAVSPINTSKVSTQGRPQGFHRLMNRLIRQLDHTGVLNSETLVLDATFIKAYSRRDPQDSSRGLSDSEARLRKQGRNVVLGYGVHMAVDASSEMPLAVAVKPANVNEKKVAPSLLHKTFKHKHRWKSVTADSQYSSEAFRDKARRLGVEPVIPYPKNQMKGKNVLRVDRGFHTHGPAKLRHVILQEAGALRRASCHTYFEASKISMAIIEATPAEVTFSMVGSLLKESLSSFSTVFRSASLSTFFPVMPW